MPETIDFTDKPYFNPGTTFADVAQVTVGVTYTINEAPFEDIELHDYILPELKLTRQHGKYFDLDDDCDTTVLVL